MKNIHLFDFLYIQYIYILLNYPFFVFEKYIYIYMYYICIYIIIIYSFLLLVSPISKIRMWFISPIFIIQIFNTPFIFNDL